MFVIWVSGNIRILRILFAEMLAVVAGGLWVSCGAGEPGCSASQRSRIIRGVFAWPFEFK